METKDQIWDLVRDHAENQIMNKVCNPAYSQIINQIKGYVPPQFSLNNRIKYIIMDQVMNIGTS